MVTYAVPLERNRSRLFFAMSVPKEGAPWFFKLLTLRPSWLRFQDHLGQHKVLDGDNVFLHQQVGNARPLSSLCTNMLLIMIVLRLYSVCGAIEKS